MAVYGQTIPQNRVRRYRQNLTGYRQNLRIPAVHGGFNKVQCRIQSQQVDRLMVWRSSGPFRYSCPAELNRPDLCLKTD